jgi:uncharacterized protein (DUF433 family)
MSPVLVSRSEAAALSGASRTTVKKAVDQKVIPTCRVRSQSFIEADDVAVLVMFEALAGVGLLVQYKRAVRNWLRDSPDVPELELTDALVVRRLGNVDEARERARRYARLRDEWIVRDPDVKGGDPVIKGTRVGVHTLAARTANGDSEATLDEDFPHIPREAREVAVQFARANPRRGRPPRSARKA